MKPVILFIKLIMLGMIFLSFPACNGILGGIYDEPLAEEKNEFGFIETDETNNSGTVYIDATSYTKWTYIDFHTLTVDSLEISEEMQEPENWDIAIHRYDAKTNGAFVLETGFTGLSTIKASGEIPEGGYVSDEWTTNKIVVDMSGMMDGKLKYAESYYNRELSKWLFVDTSTMPPGYNPSNKVYVIRLKDNTVAAVRLRNFMNASGVKGYMTIDYIYPFEV
ncbi:HmuY family protein [Proteiniphilum acetatigenes]|uniref:HmuY family protein n=1 Tax=Proteiniphilum acetatigenes TaxID=294710 RepID=UPI0003723F0F|nr:HmuY family protein [Proteiniphilum acetatigenes]